MKLTIVTWNRGNGSTWDLARVLLQLRPDVLALQEFSDAPKRMRRLLRALGYQQVVSNKPGASATPMWVRAGLKILGTSFVLAVEAGDGPDINKDKYIGEVRLREPESDLTFIVRNLHAPWHQSNLSQRLAAHRMIEQAFTDPEPVHVDACFVVGDFNRSAHRVVTKRLDGWECSQLEQRLPTHGKGWTPDQQWRLALHPRQVAVRRQSSRVLNGTRSDHRPYACTYVLWEV